MIRFAIGAGVVALFITTPPAVSIPFAALLLLILWIVEHDTA